MQSKAIEPIQNPFEIHEGRQLGHTWILVPVLSCIAQKGPAMMVLIPALDAHRWVLFCGFPVGLWYVFESAVAVLVHRQSKTLQFSETAILNCFVEMGVQHTSHQFRRRMVSPAGRRFGNLLWEPAES